MVKAKTSTTAVVSIKIRTEAEVKAEALREAADDLYGDNGPDHPLSTAEWLRARAAALVDQGPDFFVGN